MSTNGHGNSDEIDKANKRAALAGQWRTPPMPVYPAGYSTSSLSASNPVMQQAPTQQTQVSTAPPMPPDQDIPELPEPTRIPLNTVDYAKALQAAYRQGAEAAARLAQQQQQQQQQQQIPTAASCPNFSTGPNGTHPPHTNPHAGLSAEEAAYAHQVHPSTTSLSDAMATSMPPPPHQQQQQQQQQQYQLGHGAPQPVQQQQQQHHLATVTSAPALHLHHTPSQPLATHPEYAPQPTHHAPPTSTSTVVKSTQGRSLSMPDMSAYAAQAEEEKRQKRLARNRASARLRRLRKKNLVDAYETEVGILEKTLKQLKAHEWGRDDDHTALLEALGMERGQQAIPPDQRTAVIQDILSQQMEQVRLLQQTQLEQECLTMMAFDENMDDEMVKELQDLLQLTPEQKQQLRDNSNGLDYEVEALETVAASLQAMQENKWLLNEGVQEITDQFTSILHKNQLSKFLLWTDTNAEAIDQLDHVHVQPLQGAPIFTFGVETTPYDDDDCKG